MDWCWFAQVGVFFFEGICLPGTLFAVKKEAVVPPPLWEALVGVSVCPWDELQDLRPLEKADVVHIWMPGGLGLFPLLWLVSAVWEEGGSGSLILKELFHPSLRLLSRNGNRNARFCILGMPMVPREAKPWVGPATYWLLPDAV